MFGVLQEVSSGTSEVEVDIDELLDMDSDSIRTQHLKVRIPGSTPRVDKKLYLFRLQIFQRFRYTYLLAEDVVLLTQQ